MRHGFPCPPDTKSVSVLDLLHVLGSDFDLSALEGGRWMCIQRSERDQKEPVNYWIHECAVECLAMAYLDTHNVIGLN